MPHQRFSAAQTHAKQTFSERTIAKQWHARTASLIAPPDWGNQRRLTSTSAKRGGQLKLTKPSEEYDIVFGHSSIVAVGSQGHVLCH